jgi:7-cyano-7-deazaguanine synthase
MEAAVNGCVCLFSGGLDSTVLLYEMLKHGPIYPLSIYYGQRHSRELVSVREICARLRSAHQILHLPMLNEVMRGSSQTDISIDVPEGHYEDASMRATVVPNRNMVLLSIAIAYAISVKCRSVAYAAHAGDHAIYPDCRIGFVEKMREVAELCDYEPIRILTPFIGLSKADIVARGAALSVPFELTWSCYKGMNNRHCGVCGTCVERREAFERASISDPTVYETR